jgi:hypothetical protein
MAHPISFTLWIIALYFLPWITAALRGMHARTGVCVLNVFLGWTIIGWIAALIWAVSGDTEQQVKAKTIDYDKLAAAMRSQQNPPPPR